MSMKSIATACVLGFDDLARRWRDERRANVSITYAFALVPLLAILGLGSDWYRQQSYNKRLQNAADAAAIVAVTTAKAYIVANSKNGDVSAQAIANGKAQAAKVFAVNAGSSANTEPVTPTINFPPPLNSTYTATVSYSTTMPTYFGKLPGFNTATFPLSGSSTSSVTIGLYLDFYVAVDVSGSMGIPTTTDGQTALANVNPDNRSQYPSGCVFACHYSGSQGYSVAKSNNPAIALRIDTVGQALSSMITTAGQQATNNGISNEYRIGLYPFIVHAVDAAPLSANFTQAQSVANSLGSTYLDQGWNNSSQPTSSTGTQIGSGGTHWENLASDITNYVKIYGNGLTAAAPKPFLFIITDGVDNNQTYPFNGSQPQVPNTSVCAYAQQYNFTVAVLYIPYVPIANPNASFANNEDGKTNNLIPPISNQVPAALQACASAGFYFTASSQADINNAMQTMFFQAVQSARLTQ